MCADQSIQKITVMRLPLLGPATVKRTDLGRRGRRKLQTKSLPIAEGRDMVYVGIDLHKKNTQIAAADERGKILMNKKIPHTREAIRYEALHLPKHARYVIESSSVWEGTYRYMTKELGLDVIVSNLCMTLLTAKSKKKTDKVDAAVLADMLRGAFISQCYVPDRRTSDERKAVRHRHKLVGKRPDHKNAIHGILLQISFESGAAVPFTPVWLTRVRRIGDYRIDDHLMQIRSLNESIIKSDVRIAGMAKDNPDAIDMIRN